jgi:hypothetical protein
MRFWFRELMGWLLVGLGLLVLFVCVALVLEGRILEAGPLSVVGIIVFRGGIHLLKVAVAARICLQARERLREDRRPRDEVIRTAARAPSAPGRPSW